VQFRYHCHRAFPKNPMSGTTNKAIASIIANEIQTLTKDKVGAKELEKVKNNFRGGRHELAHHFGLGLFFVLVNEKKQGYLPHNVPQHPARMCVSHPDG